MAFPWDFTRQKKVNVVNRKGFHRDFHVGSPWWWDEWNLSGSTLQCPWKKSACAKDSSSWISGSWGEIHAHVFLLCVCMVCGISRKSLQSSSQKLVVAWEKLGTPGFTNSKS
jgi:hypothetical protein